MHETELGDVIGPESEGGLHLWYTPADSRLRANLTALKQADNDSSFIFVMVRYPYPDLEDTLDELGVAGDRNAFIDAKTHTVATETDMSQRNVLYMKSPQNLQNIGTAISTVGSDRKDAVVVIDSFTTLNTYNKEEKMILFLENLQGRLKTLGFNAIMFQDDQPDERLSPRILSHFDDIHSWDD